MFFILLSKGILESLSLSLSFSFTHTSTHGFHRGSSTAPGGLLLCALELLQALNLN